MQFNVEEMPAEYTRNRLGMGVRGKYYEASHNVVQLTPEVVKVFPNDKAVASITTPEKYLLVN
jgi:hypothetical protein